MYGGGDSNTIINTRAITSTKDTLHISPHIAAHKSVLSVCPQDLQIDHDEDDIDNRLVHGHSTMCHLPTYKINSTSPIYKSVEIHSTDNHDDQNRMSYIQEFTKIQPQDLSAHSQKFTLATSMSDTSVVKSLPHIHSAENIAGQVLMSERTRSPPTYYRLLDGTTISITGQHSAIPVLLSSVNDDGHHSSHPDGAIQTPTSVATAISVGSFQGTLTSHPHVSMSNIHEGHFIIPEVITANYIHNPDAILPDRGAHLDEVKEEKLEDHKDLVRQALQEAVHNHHSRMSPNNQVLDYNYGEDIGELLMMNINVNPGSQSANRMSEAVVSGGQVVVLHPAASYNDDGNILTPGPIILTSRSRRRNKLTDEAQAIRKVKIANRMREKRANESEDQKERRRLREAERMRRKRAQEDEMSKEKRRKEAADRARLRRMKLSEEEREIERKKAAVRMRLRRQNENEEQKRLRRIKAAERMRRRRATETPEQKANRKQGIAIRMKVRRKKRPNNVIKSEIDPISENINCLEKRLQHEYEKDHSESPDTHLVQSRNAVISSVIPGLPGNIGTLHNDNSTVTSAGTMSAIELVHNHQTVSLQVRNISPLPDEEIQDRDERNCSPIYHQQEPVSSLPLGIHLQPRTTESCSSPSQVISLQKGGTHHHLPHILHNLSPQPDTHHHLSIMPSHATYIVPHTTSQSHHSIQLRHQ